MGHQRYATAWELTEAQRRHLVWERAALGAALTLGKKPVGYPRSRFAEDNELPTLEGPPPPLAGIPEDAASNWRQIVDEVLAHHGFTLDQITTKFGRRRTLEVVCAQELCYRLITFGRRGGRKMSSVEVGTILKRDHSTVLYGKKQHEIRMLRSRPHFTEDQDE